MKILPFNIPKPDLGGLIFQEDNGIQFFDKLHQHQEIQISLILEGAGTLIVGDTVNDFVAGDILIIGSYLPHVFKSDRSIAEQSKMLSLFFTHNSFGPNFFQLEELHELRSFFKHSKHGFKILSHKKKLASLFNELKSASKLTRFIILLEILKVTSRANYKSLSSFTYDKTFSDNEGRRMRDVFEYTITHFDTEISLSNISQVAAMTKTAFCKYFKKRTNKTYVQFLSELRIEHACKLLLSKKELSIVEISERSGFKNISNFNRKFKTLKGISPSEFKRIKSS